MTAAARRTAARLLAAVLLIAATSPARALAAGPDIMLPADVRPGMKGYGMTTLSGVRPQRFEVEVLGRLPGAFAKGDMVLIRMSGPVIDEAGIIAGMSGSPVYIDGKLLGAVAYGWGFTKVPLAGVTPAVDMLAVRGVKSRAPAAAKEEARQARQERSRRLAELMTSPLGRAQMAAAIRQAAAQLVVPHTSPSAGARRVVPAGLLPAGADPVIRPLPVPLSMGGCLSTDPVLLSMLDGSGFLPVQAVGTGAASAADVELEPGMTVGTALILGDMDIAGMGTLTWSDGKQALAFGHPMFGSGAADYPFVLGEVQTVVPSYDSSFKLASSGKVIGRVVQDCEPAILARLGEEPPMFPCTVRIKGARDEEFNYRIAGYWQTAPMLTLVALYNSGTRWEGEGSPCTFDARVEMRLKGRVEPLVFENAYCDTSVLWPALDLVARPMDSLLLNPYQEVEVESVRCEMNVKPGYENATIEGAWADRTRVEPGGRVTVYVRLKPYRAEEVVRTLTLDVPDTARPGSELQILVCDGGTSRAIEAGLDPGLYSPISFEGLVESLAQPQSNRDLVMRASVMDQGLRYAGAAMPALPPSARSIIEQNDVGGRSQSLVTDIVQRVSTPWVVEGGLVISLTVKERGLEARGAAPQPGSAPGGER